jgi:hypothetical protein
LNFASVWMLLTGLLGLLSFGGLFFLTGTLSESEAQTEAQAQTSPTPSPTGGTSAPTSAAAASTATTVPVAIAATTAPVAVAATPAPTETPPPPTPTLPPSPVPTINAPEIQGRVSRESGFEYGAHVGFDITDPDKLTKMQIAGMNWMKIQIRFKPGMNADDYGWQVQFLHERGIKILWGVVGEKADIFSPGYIEAYSAFVARLAEIGSDAIEVWNEPNIDREWPTGQVSGESYMRLLRPAYEAIKARNPSTIVISAATAPTGFFGGCKAEGCDDDVYYQQLAQAGAANYLDCVGAHYNEGVVSPLATTGDPRNPYPTQYLISNTDRAYLPFASSGKPVCYTELGYLTAEGYDSGLPPGFEWAGGVTVANQAAWLATAAVVLSQTGHVRLMIIWNLDYKDFNPDPHGGFAMIRPDGGCPACDSLGLVKP